MRIGAILTAFLVAAGPVPTVLAADVILKDGQAIPTSKPYVVKGKMALLTRTDGTLVSVPLEDVDLQKTAAAATAPVPTPEPKEKMAVPRPMTPADAAKAKGTRKATVFLTDRDFARGGESVEGEKDDKAEKDNLNVTISGVSATRTKTGYSIDGSAINSGKGDVRGVSVTIEAIGEDGKTTQTVYANLAKDFLTPGEKAAFAAEVATPIDVKSFKYVPTWQITVPVKSADPGAAPKAGEAPAKAAVAEEAAKPAPASKPEPAPTPEIRLVPRPDVPPPAASGPVGAPTTPGGAYLPRPSDSQAAAPKTN